MEHFIDQATQWFLINIVLPLSLPFFMIVLLAVFAGAKPDTAVKGSFDLIGAVCTALLAVLKALFSLIEMILRIIFKPPAKDSKEPTSRKPKGAQGTP